MRRGKTARVTAQKSEASKNNGGISQRLKLNEWHGAKYLVSIRGNGVAKTICG
jgi:hypothetical protein